VCWVKQHNPLAAVKAERQQHCQSKVEELCCAALATPFSILSDDSSCPRAMC
jgi:hypothetical protein